MKITRRQEEFVKKLHDLNQELDRPIHYSILAERLGVSPFTAYDMLCLLEEKGLVTSEYQLAADKSGPGRAERVFFPSEEAQARKYHMLKAVGAQDLDQGDLHQLVLERIRSGNFPDPELAEEMLKRVPPVDHSEELSYCMEVMGVIVLRLRQSGGRDTLNQYWREILPLNIRVNNSNLGLFAGFAFGILAQECISDAEWVNKLFEHVSKYHQTVLEMNLEEAQQLRDYIVELMTS